MHYLMILMPQAMNQLQRHRPAGEPIGCAMLVGSFVRTGLPGSQPCIGGRHLALHSFRHIDPTGTGRTRSDVACTAITRRWTRQVSILRRMGTRGEMEPENGASGARPPRYFSTVKPSRIVAPPPSSKSAGYSHARSPVRSDRNDCLDA